MNSVKTKLYCTLLLLSIQSIAIAERSEDFQIINDHDNSFIYANNWGEEARCPIERDNFSEAVVAVCGSGRNADCENSPMIIQCNLDSRLYAMETETVTASGWGNRIGCPENQLVIGICGSGESPDCGGKPSHITCGRIDFIEDNIPEGVDYNELSIESGNGTWISSPNFGGWASCPNNMVATGFCGSGENKDCAGNVTEIRCSKIILTDYYLK